MANPKPKTNNKAKAKKPSAYDKALADLQEENKKLRTDLDTLSGDFKRLTKSHGFVF